MAPPLGPNGWPDGGGDQGGGGVGCEPPQHWDPALARCVGPTGPTGNGPVGPCPPGQALSHGGNPNNPLRCRPVSGGGGGRGGPIAPHPVVPGGPHGAQTGVDGASQDSMSSTIWNTIQDALNGKFSPYDPSTIAAMKGQVFSAAMGRKAAGEQSVNDDLVSRGLARSGIGTSAHIDLENAANQAYTGGVTQIMIDKAQKEAAIKLQALDAAQKHLDSLRAYIVSRESNANQREIGLAQIQLGYAKIKSEKELLQMQLAKMGGGGGGQDWGNIFLQLAGQH